MEGESRELGDAGVGRWRVGGEGAKRQGLAPGVGAGGDAVVDGCTEELVESVGGFEVEGGGSPSSRNGRAPCYAAERRKPGPGSMPSSLGEAAPRVFPFPRTPASDFLLPGVGVGADRHELAPGGVWWIPVTDL